MLDSRNKTKNETKKIICIFPLTHKKIVGKDGSNVADPDPGRIRIQPDQWIRIQWGKKSRKIRNLKKLTLNLKNVVKIWLIEEKIVFKKSI